MTSGPQVAPDPVIQTALKLLPVPEHGPAFWAELDRLLDAEVPGAPRPPARDGRRVLVAAAAGSRADARALAPDTSLALVPPALRRRSNLVLTAVAVAAAVMVVVAGTTLVRQRAGESVDTSDLASEAEGPEDGGRQSTTSLATLSSAAAAPPTEAVLAWVSAVGAGDTDAAWDALGPASRAHFGSAAAFEAASAELAEGFGAWASAAPDEVLVMPLGASGGELVVVTLVGTVTQEGLVRHRADAVPVRLVDGAPRVEPFAFAGELEVVVPAPADSEGERPLVHADDELVIVVPRGVEPPVVRLDDGEPLVCGEADGTELAELEDAPGQRCSFHPPEGIPAGVRVLTVAFVSPDGAGVAAESVLFEAA